MTKSIYVVAGEISGDSHAAGLLEGLLATCPNLAISGRGGPKMEALTNRSDYFQNWVADAAVMGIWEVLKRYRWFRERFEEMLAEIERLRPDVLLLIDYPGFNLRFAKAVRERLGTDIAILYYISPQVWAWNRGRIPKMVRLLDEMMCLFPFEQAIFQDAGLRTTFVGHPMVDALAQRRGDPPLRETDLIGLFPGSREREIARLFPMMIDAAKRLREEFPGLRFECPAATPALATQLHQLLAAADAAGLVQILDGGSHELMQRAWCGVVASGTATLEAACFGMPHCIVYRVAPATAFIARRVIKVDFLGIVNILAGREVVREFIQEQATAENVAGEIRGWLADPPTRDALATRLADTAAMLGEPGSHYRAADRVAEWLENPAGEREATD